MNPSRPIHVMVLAPLPAAVLEDVAARLHRAAQPHGEHAHRWELRAGRGAYTAVLTREPGTESSEWPIAEEASRAAAEPVFSLWFDPEHRRVIHEWRGGVRTGEREADPVAFARGLGITLEPPDVATPSQDAGPAAATVAVVDGLDVAAVRALLGSTADEGWLQLTPAGGSTVLTAPDGDLRSAPWDLTDALPDREVYFVHHDRARGELSIQVLRGGDTVGTFSWPPVASDQAVPSIRGATTPDAILDALGVPPALFARRW